MEKYAGIKAKVVKSEETKTGIIKKLKEPGHYGFIEKKDGSNIFFHCSGVLSPSFEELKEGDKVEFLTEDTAKGPKAIGIVVVKGDEQ